MKFKRFIYGGLVLGGSFLGCCIAWQHHAKSFLERLHPPSTDQVGKWAGLSETTHLTMLTNVPGDVWYGDDSTGHPGKFKWFWDYEDRKGSNFNCFVIAVYESGALWSTNRAKFIRQLEQIHEKMLEVQSKATEASVKETHAFVEGMAPMIMPNGRKSYGFDFAFFPARFDFHPEFDVLAYEFVEPMSYDERHPPAEKIEMPTNSFYEFFTNVDAFITSQ